MSANQEKTKHVPGRTQARQNAGELIRPPVDVYEDASGITLHADLPGVSREGLNIQVDQDTLLIEGDTSLEMSESMEVLYADVRAAHYQRRFTLSGELDTDKIEASLNDGLLTLHIPKQAVHRPRKIEVRTS